VIAGEWQKSSFCNGASSCVEVCHLPNGNVALRDGKEQDGPVLVFTPSEWAAFTAGVRDGEFDIDALEPPVANSAVVASRGDASSGPQKPPLAFVAPSQVSR
jgi:hypothetical protein